MAENRPTTSKSQDGLMSLVIGLVIVTVLSGGGGFLFSRQFLTKQAATTVAVEATAEKATGEHDGTHAAAGSTSETVSPALVVQPLAPILTNLAKPKGLFVRLEGSILIEKDAADASVLAAKIGEDVVILLRSLELSEIQGVNGLAHLRDDINDRVRIRSEGKVREFIISSLVIE